MCVGVCVCLPALPLAFDTAVWNYGVEIPGRFSSFRTQRAPFVSMLACFQALRTKKLAEISDLLPAVSVYCHTELN